ncbi:MAG TPA: biopolymer transporter ExbD, partial [Acetobacteraceae bacterium]|nr:biopolymer transporter ExbD [Acetobacteraceae bacterium]
MAGFLPGNGGNGVGRGRYRPLAEINVTPLVDVMLVLLIIFMVTAPLMTSGVNVDLPKTSAQPINSDSQPLTVSINALGHIFLQDQEVQLPELVNKLQAISQNNADRRI